MKCKKCNAILKEDDLFCPECGTKVEKAQIIRNLDSKINESSSPNLDKPEINFHQEIKVAKKSSKKKFVIIIVCIIAIIGALIGGYFILNKDKPILLTETNTTHDYPSKNLLREGFYMNFETELDDLIYDVDIESWYVELTNDDTVTFTIKYQSESDYRVACMSVGADSFSTLYEPNGSSGSMFANENEIHFRIPFDIYTSTLTEGFNIIITDSFNIGASESGRIYTTGMSVQSSAYEYTSNEALSYFIGLKLTPSDGVNIEIFDQDEENYGIHATSEATGASIGWFGINKRTFEITDNLTNEVLSGPID